MLGLGTSLSRGKKVVRTYVKDGLKLYMPYRGSDASEVKFVGTGSTSFDGGDYLSLGTGLFTGGETQLTISAWVNPESFSGGGKIITKKDSGNPRVFYLAVNGTDKNVTLLVTATDYRYVYTANDVFNVGEWVHLVGTYNFATDTGKIYINGSEVSTTPAGSAPATSIGSNSIATYIGRDGGTSAEYFKGSIKNVSIWSRCLTATEIQNVMYRSYAEVSGRLASGLVSWWALDATQLDETNLFDIDGDWGVDETSHNWNAYGGATMDASVNGEMSVTRGSSARGMYLYTDAGRMPVSPENLWVVGNNYRFVGTTSSSISSETSGLEFYDDGDVTEFSHGDISHDFVLNSTTDAFFRFHDMASGEKITISNWKMYKLNCEDLKGSNDGITYGATIDTDLYGGDTPVIPRAIDNARTVQADAIGAGSALFDGDNDYIDTGSAFQSLFQSPFSITCWIKLTDGTPSQAESNIIGAKSGSRIYFAVTNVGKLQVYLNSGGVESITTSASAVFSDGQEEWHHISLTVTSSQVSIYKNGILVSLDGTNDGDVSSITFSNWATDENLYIGARNDNGTADRFFDGSISQVGIWSKALDQAQIQRVMERTYEEFNADDKTDLVSYWALDEAEKALSFDGSNGTVDFGNSTSLQLAGNTMSVSAWVKFDVLNNWAPIIGNSSTMDWTNGWSLLYNGGFFRFSINHYSYNLAKTAYTSTKVWTHVVGTYDGTTMKIYVDGVVGDTTDSYSDDIDNLTNTIVGRNTGENNFLEAGIAQIAIYNIGLSASEILTQYNLGVDGDYSSDSGLAGYWKMDNASTITDLSGNGNTGTVDGATLVDGAVLDKTSNNNDGAMN